MHACGFCKSTARYGRDSKKGARNLKLEIRSLKVGPIQTNCYIVADGDECIVIDPGAEAERIIDELDGRIPKMVVLTHQHWDHIGALSELEQRLEVPTAAHELDADAIFEPPAEAAVAGGPKSARSFKPVDLLLVDGDEIRVGDCTFNIIHTPGHTPGGICLYCPSEKVLFSGDTIFAGGRHGRTDFFSGSQDEMEETLKTKFVDVDDDTVIYPGHEGFSVMKVERKSNPLLR